MIRSLFFWRKPEPKPTRDFTNEELAEALGLTRVVMVKPHIRKAPTNPKREALHERLRQERDAKLKAERAAA